MEESLSVASAISLKTFLRNQNTCINAICEHYAAGSFAGSASLDRVLRVFVNSGKNEYVVPCQPSLAVLSYFHDLWDKCPQRSLKTS